jgi:hypothetical protein
MNEENQKFHSSKSLYLSTSGHVPDKTYTIIKVHHPSLSYFAKLD